MSEVDRPGGEGPERHGDGESPRLHVYRGGRTRATRARPATPRDVARRLSALERRVERALGGAGGGRDVGSDRLRQTTDQALAALANVRRLTLHDLRSLAEGCAALLEGLEHDLIPVVLDVLYRYWWRVDAFGLERVPGRGPVLLVVNRGGALVPYETLMMRIALAREHRQARPLLDDWLVRLPLVGPALLRAGAERGGTATMRRLLAHGDALIVCPESGQPKIFRQRYRLASFGRGVFARLAIETGTPIVPVAVIGAEEIHPVLARLDLAGRLLGLPTLPITPTFPWLGLGGLLPLPTKWLVMVGEPLDVAQRHPPAAAADPAVVARLRDQVRERLQALVLEGLRRRRSVFRG